MKNEKEMTGRVLKFNDLLTDINQEMQVLAQYQLLLIKTQKKVKELSDYYYSPDWMSDFQEFESIESFAVLGEDNAYNTLTEFRALEIKLLKTLAKNL